MTHHSLVSVIINPNLKLNVCSCLLFMLSAGCLLKVTNAKVKCPSKDYQSGLLTTNLNTINMFPIKGMEEDDIQFEIVDTIVDSDGTEETNTVSAESQGGFKKCIRRGDKICYSKMENINMLQNSKRDSYNRKSSFDATNQPDKVMSGESLYKAFTFQQGSNEEETEKCIAFWKGVMEKNLVPIKCTIIETNKSKKVPEVVEKDSPAELDDEKLKGEMAKIHDQYKTVWMNLLSELQKKRLHEVKLIGKSRCKICDSPLEEELHKVSKSEIKKEIEQLNNWTPKSKPKDRAAPTKDRSSRTSYTRDRSDRTSYIKDRSDRTSYIKDRSDRFSYVKDRSDRTSYTKDRLSRTSYAKDRSSLKHSISKREDSIRVEHGEKKISIMKQPEVPVDPEVPVQPATAKVPVPPPKPDTNTYKHIDVIGEKRRSGTYSEWRSNKVTTPCPCGYPDCDCNINPAIVSKETPSDSKYKATDEVTRGKSSHFLTSSDGDIIEQKTESSRKFRRKLSVMLNCMCSNSDCDCQALTEIIGKIELPSGIDTHIPKPIIEPKRKLGPVSSLELLERKFKTRNSIEQAAQMRKSIDDERDPDKRILETTKRENDGIPQKCTCGYEDCDCGKAEEVKSKEDKSKEVTVLEGCPCKYACDCEAAKLNTPNSSEDYKFTRNLNADEKQLTVIEF